MMVKKEKLKFKIKQQSTLDSNKIIISKRNSLNQKDISNHQNKEIIKMNGGNQIKKQLMKECRSQRRREEMN